MSKLLARRGHNCQLPELDERLRSETVLVWTCDGCGTRWQWTRLPPSPAVTEYGWPWKRAAAATTVEPREGMWHPLSDRRWYMVAV